MNNRNQSCQRKDSDVECPMFRLLISIFFTLMASYSQASSLQEKLIENHWCRERVASGKEQVIKMMFSKAGNFAVAVYEENSSSIAFNGRWYLERNVLVMHDLWEENRASISFYFEDEVRFLKVREHFPKRGSGHYTFFDCNAIEM